MVSGLAQTAADALPLPSHDDIYYHHQRLRLLDEEEEQALSIEERQQHQQQQQQLQQAIKEQRKRRERPKLSSSSLSSPNLVRRKSQAKNKEKSQAVVDEISQDDDIEDSVSKQVSQLSVREGYASVHAAEEGDGDDEEGLGWDIEDKELLESLEAEVLEHGKMTDNIISNNNNNNNSDKNNMTDPRTGSNLDTPARNALESSTALASKKNE